MPQIKRTNSDDADYKMLVMQLDQGLSGQYENHATVYAPHNLVGELDTVVVAYENEKPVGCGCFKGFDKEAVEIKRMFVHPGHRKKGIASDILAELEYWAKEKGYVSSVLETGTKQIEAIPLYVKKGYKRIENYGPYIGLTTSLCFGKPL